MKSYFIRSCLYLRYRTLLTRHTLRSTKELSSAAVPRLNPTFRSSNVQVLMETHTDAAKPTRAWLPFDAFPQTVRQGGGRGERVPRIASCDLDGEASHQLTYNSMSPIIYEWFGYRLFLCMFGRNVDTLFSCAWRTFSHRPAV